MSFRDSLHPATFRNVPFVVSSADTTVGRRTVIHEFPLKDLPAAEDMGKKAAEFTVDGFIIGDDYLSEMKRLIAALTAGGPGTLVHPSFGTLLVVLAQPGRLHEQFIERRGMVSFSLVFIEAGDESQPSVVVDTQQGLEDAADGAYDSLASDFFSQFSVAGAPDWSVASLMSEIDSATAVLADVRNSMGLDLSALAILTQSALLFKLNLVGLLNQPGDLANALIGQVRGLTDLFNFNAPAGSSSFAAARYAVAPLNTMLRLASYGKAGSTTARPDVPLNGTALRQQQADNQNAVLHLIRRSALLEASRAVVFQPFISFNDATLVRDAVYDALEVEILSAPDPVYRALMAVRVAMVADVGRRGLDLTRISTISLPESVPAMVLSYRLYGTTRYADELVERNNILNPLVMPGGVDLEVRSV